METIVSVINVTKSFKGVSTITPALQNCSITINKNSFTCIMGKSGSGKSTLLHVIGGLLPIEKGEVIVDGIHISNMKTREKALFRRTSIGFIFQFFNLLHEQTVLENILLPLDLNHEFLDDTYLDDLLSSLELKHLIHKFPSELSGGEQQRVAIARALLRKPAIILADEPTGNLDRLNSMKVIQLLKECQAKYAQTIILVTHDFDIAKQCERILYLEDGRVIQDEKI